MANEFKVKKGLIVQGSGSSGDNTILDVQGNQGQLFSITDSLSGSLFTVSDISGIPILDVDSGEIVKIGTFGSEGIIVNGTISFCRKRICCITNVCYSHNAIIIHLSVC